MALMLVCGLMVVAGLVLTVRWDGRGIRPPTVERETRQVRDALTRYLWWATLVATTGLVTAVFIAGPGGRLVMRLLAATSPDARGLVTEAGEAIGGISVEGTLGFLVFAAVPLALGVSFACAACFRWLPRGHLAGLTFGLLLLVAASTRLDPLRSGNPDFELVGPAWLAVVTLGLLVVVDGVATLAFMGWYSARLPLPRRDRKGLTRLGATAALLVLAGPFGGLALVLAGAGAGLVALAALIAPNLARWWLSNRTRTVGRALLAGGALLALPGFVTAIDDILQ